MKTTDKAAAAERFFRGVYEGDPSVVDDLAAEDIVATYPIFAMIFGSPTIRGRQAYRLHALNFAKTWADRRVTVHEVVAQNDRVVLLWSFQARKKPEANAVESSPAEESAWGGITLFRFNNDGKICAEVGEESEPGPYHRTTLT